MTPIAGRTNCASPTSFRQLRRYVRSSSPPSLVGTREGGPPSGSGERRLDVATYCAFHRQCERLHLPPWQPPPCNIGNIASALKVARCCTAAATDGALRRLSRASKSCCRLRSGRAREEPAGEVMDAPMPVSLSDAELAIVMAAAKPLLARDRDPFLRAVYDALCSCLRLLMHRRVPKIFPHSNPLIRFGYSKQPAPSNSGVNETAQKMIIEVPPLL